MSLNEIITIPHLGALSESATFLAIHSAIKTTLAFPEKTNRQAKFTEILFDVSNIERFGPVLIGGDFHKEFLASLEQLEPQSRQEAINHLFDFAYTLYGDESAFRFNYTQQELVQIFDGFSKDEVIALTNAGMNCVFAFYWEPEQLVNRFRSEVFAADVDVIGQNIICGSEEHMALLRKFPKSDEKSVMTLVSACGSLWNGNSETVISFIDSLPEKCVETVEA